MSVEIFCCYARKDKDLFDHFKNHLKPLEHAGLITVWNDADISPGSDWKVDIEKHLDSAQIILLLVSPDFMASNYCYGIEMQRALERHKRGDALVIPIILRSVHWKVAPFAKLQVLPKDAIPIISSRWYTADDAFTNVVENIIKVINILADKSTHPVNMSLKGNKNTGAPLLETLYAKAKRLCPACSEAFYPGDCEIVSGIEPDKVLKQAPSGWKRHSARINPEPLAGELYTFNLATRKCPNCGYYLPHNIERCNSIVIALVGNIASGMSHYIAAMIKEMQSGLLGDLHQPYIMSCLTLDIMKEYERDYFIPLFEEWRVIIPTHLKSDTADTKRKPLIHELRIRTDRKSSQKEVNLILYDTAGRDFISQERIEKYCRYVLNADAIIFLVDPLRMPNVANYLPPFLLSELPKDQETSMLLNTIIDTIKFHRGIKAKAQLSPIPVAITVSKSDVLKYVRGASNQPIFMHPRLRPWGYLPNEMNIINNEVKEFLAFYDSSLLKVASQLTKVKFFATSATGYHPNEQRNYPAVKPLRCLDPLHWIFYELGLIRNMKLYDW